MLTKKRKGPYGGVVVCSISSSGATWQADRAAIDRTSLVSATTTAGFRGSADGASPRLELEAELPLSRDGFPGNKELTSPINA